MVAVKRLPTRCWKEMDPQVSAASALRGASGFAEVYPDEQLKYYIAALGSETRVDGRRVAAYLCNDSRGSALDLHWIDYDWYKASSSGSSPYASDACPTVGSSAQYSVCSNPRPFRCLAYCERTEWAGFLVVSLRATAVAWQSNQRRDTLLDCRVVATPAMTVPVLLPCNDS